MRDSVETPDAPRLVEIPGPSDATRAAPAEPTGLDQPRWVMMRSLLVPGWGQLHNGSWIKALGIAAGEVTIGAQILQDERELDRLLASAELVRDTDNQRYNELVLAYNNRVDQSTRRRWILGGIVVYALLDAYIDAHFANFGVEFENDPALPGGKPSARVRMRWAF